MLNPSPTVYYSYLSCKFIYLGMNIDFTWCLGYPLTTQKRFWFSSAIEGRYQ